MPEVLTPDDSIEKLSGLDLDLAVAQACDFACPSGGSHEWRRSLATSCTKCMRMLPLYGQSIEAAMEVEDRIAELGLRSEYYRALLDLIAMSVRDRVFHHFDLIHATAEQRCRAALKALGAE